MKLRSVAAALSVVSSSFLFAAPDEAALREKVAALLAQMSTEEKIGQLVQYSAPGAETGPATRRNVEAEIAAGRVGSILNAIGVEQTRHYQKIAVEQTRLKIPLIFGYDVIHGYQTIFPINLAQAASWDLAAIENSERIAAIEASAAGIHWTFAPMVDIARDPRWGRVMEGSGEDPFLGSAIARARVRGFQGDDLTNPESLLACVKHFAAYGAAQAGRDYNTTDVPEIVLRDVYFPPFQAALEAGVGTFMAAFNDLNGVPASANKFLMTDVLRKEWGFDGFVVSDWTSIRELLPHGIAADEPEAALLAFNAGVDMDMESRLYLPHLPALVESGAVPMSRLDEAVTAILLAKARLGLFEDPYRGTSEEREKQAMLRPEHLETARDLARKSAVLLKNERSALPLRKDAKIALVGQLADTQRDLIGEWRARGREEDAVTVRTALEKAYPGRVTYALGAKSMGDDRAGFAAAVAAAKKSDVVVAVLGEGWFLSGEASSRSSIKIPGVQAELLAELRKTGKPIVLVLFAGRPLALANVLDHVDALLLAWLPGTMGGPAIVDLLSGAFSPSGKLPMTFPRNIGQVPIFYSHRATGRPFDPAKGPDKWKSQYLDVPNTPQFPFGFGLSYTTFKYSGARVASPTLDPNGEQRISVTVKNTGRVEAAEIVQLYVRDVAGSVTRPVRELKGFERVTLKPGESRDIVFSLTPQDLAFHHTDMSFKPEPGKFEVFVGPDSTAPKVGEFTYRDPAQN